MFIFKKIRYASREYAKNNFGILKKPLGTPENNTPNNPSNTNGEPKNIHEEISKRNRNTTGNTSETHGKPNTNNLKHTAFSMSSAFL